MSKCQQQGRSKMGGSYWIECLKAHQLLEGYIQLIYVCICLCVPVPSCIHAHMFSTNGLSIQSVRQGSRMRPLALFAFYWVLCCLLVLICGTGHIDMYVSIVYLCGYWEHMLSIATLWIWGCWAPAALAGSGLDSAAPTTLKSSSFQKLWHLLVLLENLQLICLTTKINQTHPIYQM